MATLIPYSNFHGRCKEAMNFYKSIFGGELELQIAGDSPAKEHITPELHDKVLHSHLKGGMIEMMATDMAPVAPIEGNTIYLALICKDEAEIKSLFEKLSEKAKIEQPLQKAFFGWFGSLEDQFGRHWMFQGDAK